MCLTELTGQKQNYDWVMVTIYYKIIVKCLGWKLPSLIWFTWLWVSVAQVNQVHTTEIKNVIFRSVNCFSLSQDKMILYKYILYKLMLPFQDTCPKTEVSSQRCEQFFSFFVITTDGKNPHTIECLQQSARIYSNMHNSCLLW